MINVFYAVAIWYLESGNQNVPRKVKTYQCQKNFALANCTAAPSKAYQEDETSKSTEKVGCILEILLTAVNLSNCEVTANVLIHEHPYSYSKNGYAWKLKNKSYTIHPSVVPPLNQFQPITWLWYPPCNMLLSTLCFCGTKLYLRLYPGTKYYWKHCYMLP